VLAIVSVSFDFSKLEESYFVLTSNQVFESLYEDRLAEDHVLSQLPPRLLITHVPHCVPPALEHLHGGEFLEEGHLVKNKLLHSVHNELIFGDKVRSLVFGLRQLYETIFRKDNCARVDDVWVGCLLVDHSCFDGVGILLERNEKFFFILLNLAQQVGDLVNNTRLVHDGSLVGELEVAWYRELSTSHQIGTARGN